MLAQARTQLWDHSGCAHCNGVSFPAIAPIITCRSQLKLPQIKGNHVDVVPRIFCTNAKDTRHSHDLTKLSPMKVRLNHVAPRATRPCSQSEHLNNYQSVLKSSTRMGSSKRHPIALDPHGLRDHHHIYPTKWIHVVSGGRVTDRIAQVRNGKNSKMQRILK